LVLEQINKFFSLTIWH